MATLEQLSCALKKTQAKDICAPSAVLDMAREWKGMGENLFKSLVDCFSDIESREKALSLVRESVEKRLKDLEKREREFDLFQEGKKVELELREEKLDEQLKLVGEHIEKLEVSQSEVDCLRLRNCKELKEIEMREREIEFTRMSLEKRLREVEKREKDFEAFRNGKLKELDLIEEVLGRNKEFVEEVKLTNEKLWEKQKIGYGLIERLEEALNMLEGMKVVIDERFEEIKSWVTAAHESLTGKLNEADLIRESLEKRFQEFEEIEKTRGLLQEGITKKLVSKKGQLGTVKMGLLEDIELREAKPTEQQMLGKQLSEYLENMVGKKIKEIDSDEELIVNVACEALDASAKRADVSRGMREKSEHGMRDERKIREIDPHVHFTIDPHTSVDSKHALEKDEKTLELLINSIDKELELMDDEIFKILLLSSDPAKIVLDAVKRFYTGSKEFKVRRVAILLLDQLTKMSPNIQPCVTEAAIKVAREWKSKLCTTAKDPLEVLGFLHLLAAYNLSSNFDKIELSSFVKLVAQHKQTPELCRILGLADKIHGFIQSLINEKQYLLASTYIYECELEHRFPQAAVLNYYVKHAKLSAKARCRREHRSSEAQDKANDSEIADLRVAIEHIIKYGLESEYSPDVLTERIKQLESNRASWRYRSPTSSVDIQKRGKNKRCWDADKRNNGPMTQAPQQGSECWSSSPRQIKTERHSPILAVVDDHPGSAHKRHRTGPTWFHDG